MTTRRRLTISLTLAPGVIEALRRRAAEGRLSLSVLVERILTGLDEPVGAGEERGTMRLGLWIVWYFDEQGRRLAGDDPAIPLPEQVRAPYALARSHVTGEYRWWAGGRWHDQQPAAWPGRARLAPTGGA